MAICLLIMCWGDPPTVGVSCLTPLSGLSPFYLGGADLFPACLRVHYRCIIALAVFPTGFYASETLKSMPMCSEEFNVAIYMCVLFQVSLY